jgi:hypothetical protein
MKQTTRAFFGCWFRLVGTGFLFFAAFVLTLEFFTNKLERFTGAAEWVWQKHPLASQKPVAFFATKTFDVPAEPAFVHVKVAGDPEYTLFLNGEEVGGNVAGSRAVLDEYDVTSKVHPGRNRIVAALRSANGVGGFILSIDFGPKGENAVVTDSSWQLYDEWSDALIERDVPALERVPLLSIGRPPIGRWNNPEKVIRKAHDAPRRVVAAISAAPYRAPLREIRVINGVAVASTKPVRATVFDFGIVHGRGRVEAQRQRTNVIFVRYANDLSDLETEGVLRSFVFAKGERSVTDPVPRDFRYMGVYDRDVAASVVATERVD